MARTILLVVLVVILALLGIRFVLAAFRDLLAGLGAFVIAVAIIYVLFKRDNLPDR